MQQLSVKQTNKTCVTKRLVRNVAERYKQIYEEGDVLSGMIALLERERGLPEGSARRFAIQHYGEAEVMRFELVYRSLNGRKYARTYRRRGRRPN